MDQGVKPLTTWISRNETLPSDVVLYYTKETRFLWWEEGLNPPQRTQSVYYKSSQHGSFRKILFQNSLSLSLSLSHTHIFSKLADHSRGRSEGSLFNSYKTKVLGRVLLFSLDFSIKIIFDMTQPGIEPRSLRLLANTRNIMPMDQYTNTYGLIDYCVGWSSFMADYLMGNPLNPYNPYMYYF